MNEERQPPAGASALAKWRRLATWTAVGLIVGLVVIILLNRFGQRANSLAPLSLADWQQARQRWVAAGIRDYQIEIRVTGRQAATYQVDVVGGEAIEATRDGHPLPQRRTWGTWTVEGMFETMARDFESVERQRTGRADASTPNLSLRGDFDRELGLPRRYLRIEMVQRAANPEVSWEVLRFQRNEGSASK